MEEERPGSAAAAAAAAPACTQGRSSARGSAARGGTGATAWRSRRSWGTGSAGSTLAMEVPEIPSFSVPPPPPPMAAASSAAPPATPAPRLAKATGGALAAGAGAAGGSGEGPLAESLQRATEVLGRMLRGRMDDMEEALERSLERMLESTLARVLGAGSLERHLRQVLEGAGSPGSGAGAGLGGVPAGFAAQRAGAEAPRSSWIRGLYTGSLPVAEGSTADGHRPAQGLVAVSTSETPETEADGSGARTEPVTPCSTGSDTALDGPRPSSASAPAQVGGASSSREPSAHFLGVRGVPPPLAMEGQNSMNLAVEEQPSRNPSSRGSGTLAALALEGRRLSEESGSVSQKEGTVRRKRPADFKSNCSSCSVSSISPGMWPVWCNSERDAAAAQSENSQEREPACMGVDVRVRLREMEATGMDTKDGFLDADLNLSHCQFGARQSVVTSLSRCQRFVMHPTSNPILVWHIIGPIMLAYDIVMIPMRAFPLGESLTRDVIAIIITTYWTLDTLRGFFTGFETENTVEMRPSEIAKRYVSSWFVIDFGTCALDWAFIIGGSNGMFNKFWRTTRAVQAWRILRLVRLVRVIKFVNRVSAYVDQILSVQALIAIKSIYIGTAVIFFCHYMACYWYMVADLAMEENMAANVLHPSSTWLQEHRLEDAPLFDVYCICFHWALGQSGFAPSNIFPTNKPERIYASCVSFAWLIIVSVIINLFSMWLKQLREVNQDREEQRIKLRKYLEEHEVSRKLTYRVLRCFRLNYKAHMRRVHEEDIEFLRDLPLALKVSLHKEVYLPVLKSHPFFRLLDNISESLPVMISHLAMREDHYLASETVFREDTPAGHMLYVLTGRLDYYAVHMDMHCSKLKPGEWVCEPALWLRWVLRGRLVTASSSELVGVNVERFHAIMQDARLHGEDLNAVRQFAVDTCEHFVTRCPDTDLWRDKDEIQRRVDVVTGCLNRSDGSPKDHSLRGSVRSLL